MVAAPLHTARFFPPSGVALPDLGGAFLAEAALHDPALHGDAVEGSVDFGHIVTSTGAFPAMGPREKNIGWIGWETLTLLKHLKVKGITIQWDQQ